jgi:hypothetical protein
MPPLTVRPCHLPREAGLQSAIGDMPFAILFYFLFRFSMPDDPWKTPHADISY